MSVTLLFPPSWTFCTGSPHLALPMLKAYLAAAGVEATSRDLNWEVGQALGVHIDRAAARAACADGTLEAMNEPYFEAEDRLDALARTYSGTWNAQLGFTYW